MVEMYPFAPDLWSFDAVCQVRHVSCMPNFPPERILRQPWTSFSVVAGWKSLSALPAAPFPHTTPGSHLQRVLPPAENINIIYNMTIRN